MLHTDTSANAPLDALAARLRKLSLREIDEVFALSGWQDLEVSAQGNKALKTVDLESIKEYKKTERWWGEELLYDSPYTLSVKEAYESVKNRNVVL